MVQIPGNGDFILSQPEPYTLGEAWCLVAQLMVLYNLRPSKTRALTWQRERGREKGEGGREREREREGGREGGREREREGEREGEREKGERDSVQHTTLLSLAICWYRLTTSDNYSNETEWLPQGVALVTTTCR